MLPALPRGRWIAAQGGPHEGRRKFCMLNISKEAFKYARARDRRNFESPALEPWRREVHQFWEENIHR